MKRKVVILIILVGFVIGVIMYSSGGKINIFNVKFWIIWPSVIFLSSFLSDLFIKKYSIITAILISLGVMLGLIINNIFDTIINSTSHSLLGLEVIGYLAILFIIGPTALLGVGLSQLILFFRRRQNESTS
jgi:hypothetical protein